MELEITVRWCKGLTAFNFFQKLTLFVCVSLISKDDNLKLTKDQKQEQKTPVDHNGEGNPEWNHSIKFDLRLLNSMNSDFSTYSVRFEIRNPGQFFGDKIIGEVCVPLKELIQSVGAEVTRFVSYQVRNPDGKSNGILEFSYKVIGNNPNFSPVSDVHITGYHHHHHHHHEQLDHNDHYTSGLVADSEKIQYPKLDYNSTDSVPPLVYPPNSYSSLYSYDTLSSSSSSFTSMTTNHCHPSTPSLYPPPAPPQTWALPSPALYPPPPQPHLDVYPPPPPPTQPYGDPHWGYHNSSGYHHWA
ncbi:unnamed protein product [Amaranthus hypochondriacus]